MPCKLFSCGYFLVFTNSISNVGLFGKRVFVVNCPLGCLKRTSRMQSHPACGLYKITAIQMSWVNYLGFAQLQIFEYSQLSGKALAKYNDFLFWIL